MPSLQLWRGRCAAGFQGEDCSTLVQDVVVQCEADPRQEDWGTLAIAASLMVVLLASIIANMRMCYGACARMFRPTYMHLERTDRNGLGNGHDASFEYPSDL